MRNILLATCLAAVVAPACAADLALHRVMLSAAGVGYFEFRAQVEGSTALGLDVPLDQVDDVLRSLAVLDDHGGVGSIELPGRAPGGQADRMLGADLGSSAASMLQSLRGEEIAVTGPQAMTGRIVGTSDEVDVNSAQPNPRDGRRGETVRTRVTLMTVDGFRQFILEDATAIRLTDATLRARVGAALDAARQQAALAMRHLTLRAGGDGARTVSVGYVVAAPIWKASYRVVLPAAAGDQARIQGWAVLENQSGADWHGVDLTLHAGNPVTFHQAIYASYYADRPEVPVEVMGRILPEPDERAIALASPTRMGALGPIRWAGRPGGNVRQSPPPPPQAAIVPGSEEDAVASAASLAEPTSQPQADETVIDTVFHIATPIDLQRGHSASVPIIDEELPAEQLDLLPVSSNRPVSALRLTNSGAASLPGGALTLYTSDPKSGLIAFAGDARLSGLPAGESRLLGFAEDLRTSAERSTSSVPNTILHVEASKCRLRKSLRHRTVYSVMLAAPVHEKRRVLVEFVRSPGETFSLDGGALPGQEQTATAWRVPVNLQPGEVRHLTAYSDLEFTTDDQLLLNGNMLNDQVVFEVLGDAHLDKATMAKLHIFVELRRNLNFKQDALRRLTEQQAAAEADEERLRNNLRVVAGPDDLHAKLVAALDSDETNLGRLRTEMIGAQGDVDQAQSAIEVAACKLEL